MTSLIRRYRLGEQGRVWYRDEQSCKATETWFLLHCIWWPICMHVFSFCSCISPWPLVLKNRRCQMIELLCTVISPSKVATNNPRTYTNNKAKYKMKKNIRLLLILTEANGFWSLHDPKALARFDEHPEMKWNFSELWKKNAWMDGWRRFGAYSHGTSPTSIQSPSLSS
jgi:hypothetical protein